ncbi:unnamed protein product [Lactuca saligna]|uniref:Uncharacterized protein n=1 Tax=Lactuca saligna TaxID=75948 RepID=A0AA35YZT4_LACSI|nr:unnamed protein product [Lactuca saligna]
MAHKPHNFAKRSRCFSPTFKVNPQISRKGGLFREVQTCVSLASKKRRAKDMAKCISKKQKNKLRMLVIHDESMDEEVVPEYPIYEDQIGHSSHVNNNLDGSMETSTIDTPITSGAQSNTSTPEKAIVISPRSVKCRIIS